MKLTFPSLKGLKNINPKRKKKDANPKKKKNQSVGLISIAGTKHA